jgi:hypothetical protein
MEPARPRFVIMLPWRGSSESLSLLEGLTGNRSDTRLIANGTAALKN